METICLKITKTALQGLNAELHRKNMKLVSIEKFTGFPAAARKPNSKEKFRSGIVVIGEFLPGYKPIKPAVVPTESELETQVKQAVDRALDKIFMKAEKGIRRRLTTKSREQLCQGKKS